MDTERKNVLSRFIKEVWNDGNVEASDLDLADRYKIHHDPGDPWHGKELDLAGYKERVRLSRAHCPDQRFGLRELFADGDAVVATWSTTLMAAG